MATGTPLTGETAAIYLGSLFTAANHGIAIDSGKLAAHARVAARNSAALALFQRRLRPRAVAAFAFHVESLARAARPRGRVRARGRSRAARRAPARPSLGSRVGAA